MLTSFTRHLADAGATFCAAVLAWESVKFVVRDSLTDNELVVRTAVRVVAWSAAVVAIWL